MPEEQQQNKSTRSFEEWKLALTKLMELHFVQNKDTLTIEDEKVRPYYDQGLQPYVCFKELFNK